MPYHDNRLPSFAPSEALECKALVRWMERYKKVFLFSHLPLNTPTLEKYAKQNYVLGVRRGVPDYVLVRYSDHRVIFIEMKKRRGAKSVVSREQKVWMRAIGQDNGFICYGKDEAMHVIMREFEL